ncbi:hypothetical protein [Janibacter alittae]|uniref:Stress response protein n=1 Tax=Janibacter alittae TaxID=3115209 RepID=A0ABZ2MKC4_9MICO
MSEETWHQARLIPTSGINGAEEQERRATSALLAVMSSVREFGQTVTKPLGAPSGKVETFIEVPFELGEQRLFPDGLIRVSRGKTNWTALVEVKTGNNDLATEQLENYLDIAREQGYDAVVTISNQIPAIAGQHPTKVDGRKLRKVALHHLSWSRILCDAVMQKEYRGVADPDQAWILGELIRYLEHPKSGALEFNDMGGSWVAVRQAVSAGTLRATDKGVPDVVARWDALLRFVSLQLGRDLGEEVTPVLSRKEQRDPALRAQNVSNTLASDSVLMGSIRIPNAAGPIVVTADLRAGQITCHVDISAPGAGRPATRVKWLTRQIPDARESLRLEAFVARSRGASAAELLGAVRQKPDALIQDPAKELKTFRVAMTVVMGSKRGRGRGAFIDTVLDAVNEFYREVLQFLKVWRASPPKMRELPDASFEPDRLSSTALSSQDGTDDVRSPVSGRPAPEAPADANNYEAAAAEM